MDLIFTQIYTLIATTSSVGSTLSIDRTPHSTGIDPILGTLTLGLIALLFIIDHLLDLNHNELELEGIEEVI